MDNYIVRILRRHGTAQLDGVVETVETGMRMVFHNAEELWAILDTTGNPEAERESVGTEDQD